MHNALCEDQLAADVEGQRTFGVFRGDSVRAFGAVFLELGIERRAAASLYASGDDGTILGGWYDANATRQLAGVRLQEFAL